MTSFCYHMNMSNSTDRYLEVNNYKTWYTVHGKDTKGVPLVVVHGGPGFPHNSLNNTAELVENGYQVVLYDQLGCGLSDRPTNKSLWNVETFLEELNELRKHLGFEVINLLGQSWGGSLVMEYCLKYGEHVDKLILHSPLIDSKLWVKEADDLKDQLPDHKGLRMRELEEQDNTDSDEYKRLSNLFDETFVMRVKPKPQSYLDTIAGAGMDVYRTMWGPSEAYATGNLKDWSIVDRLSNIQQPTLLISGKHNEATPKQMQIIENNIPNLKWKLFENSSHCANLEEPQEYLKAVSDFLSSVSN